MKCDAKKLDNPAGGFTCSVLGDTVGAIWLWDNEPYKTKIKDPPDCDAVVTMKKGLFGEKCYFECWIMQRFKVTAKAAELEAKANTFKNG